MTEPIDPEQVTPYQGVDADQKRTPSDASAFQKEMGEPSAAPTAGQQAEGVSPMELANAPGVTGSPTMQSLTEQTGQAQTTIQGIQTDLKNNQNLKFKNSQEYLMKNKLTDANERIDSALNQLGLPPMEQKTSAPGSGPVTKFLDMLEGGQKGMERAQEKLGQITESGEPIDPAQMMLIQVQLSQAQQALNFTSILLSKVVESFRTWMQTQI